MARLTLTADQRALLLVWLDEKNGLREWIVGPEPAQPENNVPRDDLNLLTVTQEAIAQRECYDFLLTNDGRNVKEVDFLDGWVSMLLAIRDSYNRAEQRGSLLAVDVAQRAGFDTWLDLAGPRVAGGAQFALPDANSLNEGPYFEGAGDGDGDYFDELDEGFGAGRGSGSGPDDSTTYWSSINAPSTDRLRTELSDVTDPLVGTGHAMRFRFRKNTSGNRRVDMIGRLLEAGTSRSATPNQVDIAATWTSFGLTIGSGQADNITDYSALQLEVEFNAVGGGSPKPGWISTMELEVPDAGPATRAQTMRSGAVPYMRYWQANQPAIGRTF